MEKLYFKDYPSLKIIENGIKNEPLLAIKVGLYRDDDHRLDAPHFTSTLLFTDKRGNKISLNPDQMVESLFI